MDMMELCKSLVNPNTPESNKEWTGTVASPIQILVAQFIMGEAKKTQKGD